MRGPIRIKLSGIVSIPSNERGWLGLATLNELLWRVLSEISPATARRIVEFLGEQSVGPALISLITGYTAELQMLSMFSQWMFVGALFFVYTPKVFRKQSEEHTDRDSFRVITTLMTGIFAILLSSSILGSPLAISHIAETFGWMGLATLLALLGYGWYIEHVIDWSNRSIDERIDVLATFVPIPEHERRELRDGISEGGWWPTVRRASLSLAIPTICVVHVFFFSLLAVIAFRLFPIVEILVLMSIALDNLRERHIGVFNREQSVGEILDIETRFYDAVSIAGWGMKGWVGLFLCVIVGLFMQGLSLAFALGVVTQDIRSYLSLVVDIGIGSIFGAVLTWNTVGFGLCFFTASAYGVWFWLRMLDRLPAFLEAWQIDLGIRDPPGREAPTTRPIGYMIPPALAMAAATLWMVHFSKTSGELTVTSLDVLFAVVWPSTILLMIVSVWKTLNRDPQEPWSDNRALPSSLLIQVGIGYLFLWLQFPSGEESGTVSFGYSPFAVLVLLSIPWIFYFEDVYQWGEQRVDIGMYGLPVYMAIFALLVLLLGSVASRRIQAVFFVLGGTSLIGALLLLVDQYFTNH